MTTPSSISQRNRNTSESPPFAKLYGLGTKLSFNLIFVDLQKVVCDALKDTFPSKALISSEIQIFRSKFEEYLQSNDIDCIVSSSNAFGLMDHGFARSVCAVLNDADNEIKTRVQQEIINRYYGEQPVGTCIIIPTTNTKIKYLAHSPTRRVNYSIKGTDNIYLTIKAICNEIRIWNENNSNDKIQNVLLTGLGTFYGAVSPHESARQTVLGWLLARLPKPKISDINWDFAMERQELIGYGGFHHFIQFINKYKNTSLTKTQAKILANALPMSIINKLHMENQCLSPNSKIKAQREGQEEKVDFDTKKKSECQIM